VATGSTASSYQSVLGIAKEATPGTPVAATAFIPVRDIKPKPNIRKLMDSSWRGSMVDVVGVQAGVQSAELSVSGDAFPDTIPWLLAGLYGSVTTTGSSAPYSHVITLLNSGNGQPTAYTVTDSDPLSTRQYASSRVTELKLSWSSEELLNYDVTWMSWMGTPTTAPTTSYTTLLPAPSWQCAASVAGSAVSNLREVEITWKRNDANPIFTLANQTSPYEIHVGPLSAEVKLTWVAATEQPLLDLLANTSQALQLNLTSGAGAGLTQIQVASSAFMYTGVEKDKGSSWIEYSATGVFVGATADAGASGGYSPGKITVQNAVTSGTYA